MKKDSNALYLTGDILTVSENVGGGDEPPRPDVFNPESPFAFTPPEYNTLPKDPPKYEELTEQYNQGFVPDNEQRPQTTSSENETSQTGPQCPPSPAAGRSDDAVPDDPPPQYSETDANTTSTDQ